MSKFLGVACFVGAILGLILALRETDPSKREPNIHQNNAKALSSLAADVKALRADIEGRNHEAAAFAQLRTAYVEWENVRDTVDTNDEYYWGTVRFLNALKAFHPRDAERPAITDADRHSIGEKEPK